MFTLQNNVYIMSKYLRLALMAVIIGGFVWIFWTTNGNLKANLDKYLIMAAAALFLIADIFLRKDRKP